ncbi:hypothetical protein [Reyranella sp.]|uniref:hypothetical protein n=1 Tax=Reyranella sp. TaxID=1929291 RepID=UPI003BACBF93
MEAANLPKRAAVVVIVGLTAACSGIQGYPVDPQSNSTTVSDLQQEYFTKTSRLETEYTAARNDPELRRAIRNEIVFGRMEVYEIYFGQFLRSLNRDASLLNVGAGILGIALGGVGAVIADTTTKSAISAAAGGIVGAQGIINKDLYYQQTIAALIAQMEANREQAKAAIYTNLKQSDSAYPLRRAYVDLELLAKAGSLPAAISALTQKANADKQESQARAQQIKLNYVETAGTKALDAWLTPDGVVSVKRVQALQAWLEKNYKALNIPATGLASAEDPSGKVNYEDIRKKALANTDLMETPAK